MKIAKVNVKPQYIRLQGGLDEKTPQTDMYPGSMLDCRNYVGGTSGGYERVDGYERFDGSPSPSDATYMYCPVTLTATVSVGDTITGVTSSATGVVCVSNSGNLDVTKVTGTFQAENITVAASPVGAITSTPSAGGETTALLHATALNAAATQYRGDIEAPEGSGPIRGIGVLNGTTYCFRDNDGGGNCRLHKETSSGWSIVENYDEIYFDTGLATIPDDTAITQVGSGATGTVKRTVLQSGSWAGSDAVGKLMLVVLTGTFNASGDIQVGAVTKMTATSLALDTDLTVGGRYEIIQENFYGGTATRSLYGADGVNRGFEFDGTVYVPIDTGMPTDTPTHCYAHKKQLFFSFQSSVQNSGPGTPYEWNAISGSTEIALGDDVTGFVSLPGQALAIMARNQSNQLLGENVDDFNLQDISNEVGCIPYTAQRMGHSMCLDDRGIVFIAASEKYGNFEQNTVSRNAQDTIDFIRSVANASVIYKSKNQYRVYGSGGNGIVMTVMDEGVAITKIVYPDTINCAFSSEDSTGKEIIFIGGTEGMVYQADKGSSFDGAEIEAFIRFPFNNSGSPTTLKTYRKALLDMQTDLYTSISLVAELSYDDQNKMYNMFTDEAVPGNGGYWDIDDWGDFNYDGYYTQTPEFRIAGTGINVGIVIHTESAIDTGHKIDGITIHYTPRRLKR